ncbi:MAG TPA: DUF4199 domain-containing protein [Cyclobacteriaceae bacterium]|mgnify:CR=1 FL=1|nr:DUF4199 domain-containing protein [Cyclobacteriaceae bacterium]
MQKLKPIARIPIKFGLMGGILAGLIMLVMYYMGRHPFLLSPLLDFRVVLFSLFIFFSGKEFRDYHQAGELYFWQGMATGIVCYLTIGIAGAIFLVLFGNLEPAFVTDYIEQATVQLIAGKEAMIDAVGTEAYETALARLPLTTITDLAGDYLIKSMVIGFFITVIISVVLRRQSKTN